MLEQHEEEIINKNATELINDLEEVQQNRANSFSNRQQLKKQITYSPGTQAHEATGGFSSTSLIGSSNSSINRNNSLDIREEPAAFNLKEHSNYLNVNGHHSNALASNHNLSYESQMSLVTQYKSDNNEFCLHRSHEYENLTEDFSTDESNMSSLSKSNRAHLKRTSELENLSEIS